MTTQTIEQALAITILQAVQEQEPETTRQLIRIVHDKLPNTTNNKFSPQSQNCRNKENFNSPNNPHTRPQAYQHT